MNYSTWFESHGQKHKKIMSKLEELSDDDVIAYFKFENMVEKEPDFCFLYKEHKKCHEMEDLNCYLCACPNFRFDDEGLRKAEYKSTLQYLQYQLQRWRTVCLRGCHTSRLQCVYHTPS